jgi:D-alanyl-D-alanine carboxypeptidase
MTAADRLNRSTSRAGAHPCRIVWALLALVFVGVTAFSPPAQARYKAIVIDADTGEVLYSRRADYRHYPASLTKMMTLYLTFEDLAAGKLTLDHKLRVSRRAAGQTPSKLGLRRGGKISVEDAILAVVVKSANDAATVLAEARGDSEIEFAIRMTQKAREIGMKRTRFRNASGLPNRRQITTARDMAVLAAALYRQYPQYYHYFSRPEFKWGKRTFRSHNKLLGRYPGMDGLKTGYIRASGFNIATSATRSGRRLIAVVLGERSSKTRNAKVSHLLNVGFNRAAKLNKFADNRNPAPKPRIKLAPTVKAGEMRAATVLARLDRILRSNRRKPSSAKSSNAYIAIKPGTLNSRRAIYLNDQIGANAPVPADGESWWGIQVGAYKRYASAQRRVHKAASALPKILMHARPSIDLIRKRGMDLYRARLLGLRKEDARTACVILKGKAFSCVPIAPNGEKIVTLASR